MNWIGQGAQATWNGQTLEDIIRSVLVSKGFEIVEYRDYGPIPDRCPPNARTVVLNAPARRLYDRYAKEPSRGGGRADLVIVAPELGRPLCIECKWQQARGSADEKLVYLFESCKDAHEKSVVIVYGGDGWSDGALEYLHAAAADYRAPPGGTEIRVMDLTEFLSWANRTLHANPSGTTSALPPSRLSPRKPHLPPNPQLTLL